MMRELWSQCKVPKAPAHAYQNSMRKKSEIDYEN